MPLCGPREVVSNSHKTSPHLKTISLEDNLTPLRTIGQLHPIVSPHHRTRYERELSRLLSPSSSSTSSQDIRPKPIVTSPPPNQTRSNTMANETNTRPSSRDQPTQLQHSKVVKRIKNKRHRIKWAPPKPPTALEESNKPYAATLAAKKETELLKAQPNCLICFEEMWTSAPAWSYMPCTPYSCPNEKCLARFCKGCKKELAKRKDHKCPFYRCSLKPWGKLGTIRSVRHTVVG